MLDYDLLVIGAGSGGLAAAQRAAGYGAKVAIVEQANLGGACVNYGCIPEKLLDYAAGFNRLEQVAVSYGWKECQRQFDWSHFVAAETRHIRQLNEVHFHHLQDAGVALIQGHGSFQDAHTLTVDNSVVTAEKILVAVGAKPAKPTLLGAEYTITWRELYHLPEQPKSVAVIGSDWIGVKIVGSLSALGSQVTQIVLGEQILPEADTEIAQEIQQRLIKQGVKVLNQTKIAAIEKTNRGLDLFLTGQSEPLTVDIAVMDVPRKPNVAKLNLDKMGIKMTVSGAIPVDEFSRVYSSIHHSIFAVGDCTGRITLTPSAIAQGRAFADSEFGGKPHSVRLDWVPISLSSRPEAAMVGLSEAQAREKFGDAVFCYRTRFRPLLYCLSGWDEKTLIKVIVNRQDSERVLGIHMIGDGAVDIIQSLAVALKLGMTKNDLDATIGIHPSSAEELFSLTA